MDKELFNVLKKSHHAYELHMEIYEHLYPTFEGPSIGGSCDGEEMDGGMRCGCWVHDLIRWIKDK